MSFAQQNGVVKRDGTLLTCNDLIMEMKQILNSSRDDFVEYINGILADGDPKNQAHLFRKLLEGSRKNLCNKK